jgi:predicted DNA-binding transcriptional regulator AlpA
MKVQSGQQNLQPSYHDVNRPSRRRLKIGGVEERTGVCRQTIWRWTKDGVFPPPHYLGSERLWWEDEIEFWEEAQMSKRAKEKGAIA